MQLIIILYFLEFLIISPLKFNYRKNVYILQ